MKNFFGSGKKPNSSSSTPPPSSSRKSATFEERDREHDASEQPPPYSSEPSSPAREKSPSKSSRKSSRPSSFAEPSKTRSSRLSRHSTDPSHSSHSHSSSRRPKYEPDTHPLNLPPEERKRLSALAAAMNGNSMDVDSEPVNGARSTTPPNQKANAQANFSVPIPNGSSHDDGAPPPPPHKSNPGSPTITPEEDAESYKNAGNRFFKDKNYQKAIEQYSKGMHCHLP